MHIMCLEGTQNYIRPYRPRIKSSQIHSYMTFNTSSFTMSFTEEENNIIKPEKNNETNKRCIKYDHERSAAVGPRVE